MKTIENYDILSSKKTEDLKRGIPCNVETCTNCGVNAQCIGGWLHQSTSNGQYIDQGGTAAVGNL